MIIKSSVALGVTLALVGGFVIVIQNVFNTNAGNKIGRWEMTTLVHGVGLVASIIVVLTIGKGNFKNITQVNPIYLLGGMLGVIIVASIITSVKNIGVVYTSMVMFFAQLLAGILVDHFGLFGLEKMPLSPSKIIGMVVVVGGLLIFRL
ncbi:MAG: DMT family transporter [Vallitaleaceae bacterium]|jgi:transporter family-2 protein|nr:DMT family transporter [Vallitaleaceae bacterium]